MIIEQTTAICDRCRCSHRADMLQRGNEIIALIHCPHEAYEYMITSNADMFLEIRKRSHENIKRDIKDNLRYALNYISITNACNFNCTVCGIRPKTNDKAVFLTMEEIMHRAEDVKKNGSRFLHLFGGEPTLHPELLRIVDNLSRMGFNVAITSNGYLLGKDKQLTRELKKRGLNRVCLQFDSLNKTTLEKLGRNYLEEKKQAINNITAAGLKLGLNCVVTKFNLHEVDNLLKHGLELGSSVLNITFASAAPTGQYKLSYEDSVDREEILTHLLKAGKNYHFSFNDIYPLPSYLPWGVHPHPDCGVHLIFVKNKNKIYPLNYFINIPKMYGIMAANKLRPNFISKYLVSVLYLLLSIRLSRLLDCIKLVFGLTLLKKKYCLINVGISDYRAAKFLNEKRISRCASAFYTSVGPVKGCLHFFQNSQFPGSREYEVLNGGC